MKPFLYERITCTLQVHAHVVEINPQTTMSCCTCTDTCRVREHVPVQVRMLNLSILPNLYHTLTDVINDNIGTSSYIESEVFSFWASRPIPYCSWRSDCPSFCWFFLHYKLYDSLAGFYITGLCFIGILYLSSDIKQN